MSHNVDKYRTVFVQMRKIGQVTSVINALGEIFKNVTPQDVGFTVGMGKTTIQVDNEVQKNFRSLALSEKEEVIKALKSITQTIGLRLEITTSPFVIKVIDPSFSSGDKTNRSFEDADKAMGVPFNFAVGG